MQSRWFVQKDENFTCILLEIFLEILKTPVISDRLQIDIVLELFIRSYLPFYNLIICIKCLKLIKVHRKRIFKLIYFSN